MDWIESERAMRNSEAEYVADLKAKLGAEAKPDVLAAMVALYRAGWRDCWYAIERGVKW